MESRTNVSRPKIIDYFSVDEGKNLIPGSSSNLKYFHPPRSNKVVFDLNRGKDLVEAAGKLQTFAEPSGIELTLEWIVANRKKIEASSQQARSSKPNFVSTLGILTRFMGAPYSPKETWQLRAGLFQGIIYLRSIETRTDDGQNNPKFGYWGHKFQNYMVSESPGEAPQVDKEIARHEEFRCVYQQKFSKYSVLYSGVRKAVLSEKVLEDPLPIDNLKFIDLRTHKKIQNIRQENSLKRYKYLAWWTNAILTNDHQILCGFRDDMGIVNEVKTYKTEELVRMSKNFWYPEECIETCETFFSQIADIVIDDCDKTIYELTKVGYKHFDVKELKPSEENWVVPEWYKKAMKK